MFGLNSCVNGFLVSPPLFMPLRERGYRPGSAGFPPYSPNMKRLLAALLGPGLYLYVVCCAPCP